MKPLSPLDESLVAALLEERLSGEVPSVGLAPVERRRVLQTTTPSGPTGLVPRLLAAALLLLGVASVVAVAFSDRRDSTRPLQDPQPTPRRGDPAQAAAAWWPLQVGHRWQYRETRGQRETEVEVLARAAAPIDGVETVQLCDVRRDAVEFSFWQVTDQGLMALSTSNTLADPLPAFVGEPALWLRTPVGAETRWRHRFLPPRPLPRGVGGGRSPGLADFVDVELELLGVAEEVIVPAGMFACVHVRAVAELAEGRREEHVWFARGIGPVRRSCSVGRTPATVRELVVFTPAAPVPSLAQILAATVGDEAGRARWLPMPVDEDAVWTTRSRLALLRDGDRKRWYRVLGAKAVPCDPTALADWQALAADDEPEELQHGLFPQRQAVGLGRMVAHAHALQRDLRLVGDGGLSIEIGPAGAKVHLPMNFVDAAGARSEQRFVVETTRGQVTQCGADD
ncbi:MAG: hypothetical protein IPK26_05030 [Planctomycetes bacterium]|nr:hypothetical protein [Planctomycetota bacterium]